MYPAADLEQLREHEEETGTPADPHLDAFMQAQAMRGKKNSVNTEFLLHLLGLGVRFGPLTSSQPIQSICVRCCTRPDLFSLASQLAQ